MSKIIGVIVVRLVDSNNENKHMLALGSHPDYDAQGWEFRADNHCDTTQ